MTACGVRRIAIHLLTIGTLWLSAPRSNRAQDTSTSPERSPISRPPVEWELDSFYTKCLLVGALPIVGSESVHDEALREAAYIVHHMLERRPELLKALAEGRTRLAVMASVDFTTDLPEHSDLRPRDYWDRRARGLGATDQRPAVSCGEENLLQFPGDPYHTENILIHEFAHAIHEMGLDRIDPAFDEKLADVYQVAIADGLWTGTYAATNHREYWAEGVQSYFGSNRENDREHNHVNTRAELQEYDPRLFAVIDEAFRQNPWQYVWPRDRDDAGREHLAGFDFGSAPTFAWPEHLKEVDLTPPSRTRTKD